MNIPSDLRYTKEHEWIRLEGGTATVGITDFAQRELGDIVFVELEPEGTELEAGAVFGTVEAVKTVSELYVPVAGTIVEVNAGLDASPESVNDDPYGAGWMIKIALRDLSEAEGLLTSDAYNGIIGK
jgi:glycine cleavage system H protein